MDISRHNRFRSIALGAAFRASGEILKVYTRGFDTEIKHDGSPVTTADRISNEIIRDQLCRTNIPVVSEESRVPPYGVRQKWDEYWLVDPLDGTREFLAGNGEFTVNIALIERSRPVMGVVLAPALQKAWFGSFSCKATRISGDAYLRAAEIEDPWQVFEQAGQSTPKKAIKKHIVAVSRSHIDKMTEEIYRRIKLKHRDSILLKKGSSLKFCDLADGTATIYPRFATTHEWDTAAGHAVLRAAGGEVFEVASEKELLYNRENLQNPSFVAFAEINDAESFFRDIGYM